jgi:hypothetical protein
MFVPYAALQAWTLRQLSFLHDKGSDSIARASVQISSSAAFAFFALGFCSKVALVQMWAHVVRVHTSGSCDVWPRLQGTQLAGAAVQANWRVDVGYRVPRRRMDRHCAYDFYSACVAVQRRGGCNVGARCDVFARALLLCDTQQVDGGAGATALHSAISLFTIFQ